MAAVEIRCVPLRTPDQPRRRPHIPELPHQVLRRPPRTQPVAEVRDQIQRPERIAYRPFSSMLLPAPWYRGRVVLVGDAAHCPTPQMASGAGMAVEDTIVLSELLGSEFSLEAALEQFMARRYERCRLVVEASCQMSEWEKHPGTPGADPVGVLAKANAALAAPI